MEGWRGVVLKESGEKGKAWRRTGMRKERTGMATEGEMKDVLVRKRGETSGEMQE